MEEHFLLLQRWLEKYLRKVFLSIISLKGVTIIAMVAVPWVLFALLDVPQESREIALLCSICEAIALVVGVGIAIFLGMAQIHSPYHTPRTLLTAPTLALLSALLVGILLALAVLQGSHLTWLHREPLVFGPFHVSWVHVTLIWFAESLLVLPLYLRYAIGRLGVSGLVDDAKSHIIRELGTSRPPIPNIVERHVKTLGDIALTALERKEYSTLDLAFLSLGNLLWKADAAARSESQFRGRADVIFHGRSIQPSPPGQTDPWRLIYRELFCLHSLMMRSSELMIKECTYLRDIGTRAIENEKASVTVLAVALFIKQILDTAIVKNDAEMAKLAPTELGYLATAAVKTALTQMHRATVHREHLLTVANRAIRGIEDAFVSEIEGHHLKENIPRTVVWDKEVLPVAVSSIARIGRIAGDSLNSKPEKMSLSDKDELDQHSSEGIVGQAIGALSTLRRVFKKSGRSSLAGNAAYRINSLGWMAARLGWSTITKAAIYEMKIHACEYLNHTGLEFKSAIIAIESIRKMGLTSVFEANDGLTALRASSALTSIAQIAIDNGNVDLALDIIGGKNSVVTILGTCRHKSVALSNDLEIGNLAVDLRGIAISQVVTQLQDKALQALHELDEWSKKVATSRTSRDA